MRLKNFPVKNTLKKYCCLFFAKHITLYFIKVSKILNLKYYSQKDSLMRPLKKYNEFLQII